MLTNKEMRDAINYAAAQRRTSYGKLVCRLNEKELKGIYAEYESYLTHRRAAEREMEERMRARTRRTPKAQVKSEPPCREEAAPQAAEREGERG